MENISENPYLQYFLGLHEFQTKPLFDTSMMTYFRKRFTADDVAAINEEQRLPRLMCATRRICRC